MKIISPIPTDYKNIERLIKIGIKDFYFGYLPRSWRKKYSLFNSTSVKSDPESYITSKAVIDGLLAKHKSKYINFNITFNSHLYCTSQIDEIIDMLGSFKDNGLTGVALSDLGLLKAIHNNYPTLKLTASCVCPCHNSEFMQFLKLFGIGGVTLSHSLHNPQEIKKMKRINPGIQLTAFANINTCINVSGLCTHLHPLNARDKAPCGKENKFHSILRLRVEDSKIIRFFELFKAGVDYVKIIARGQDTKQLIKKNYSSILLVKKINELQPKSLDQWARYWNNYSR